MRPVRMAQSCGIPDFAPEKKNKQHSRSNFFEHKKESQSEADVQYCCEFETVTASERKVSRYLAVITNKRRNITLEATMNSIYEKVYEKNIETPNSKPEGVMRHMERET